MMNTDCTTETATVGNNQVDAESRDKQATSDDIPPQERQENNATIAHSDTNLTNSTKEQTKDDSKEVKPEVKEDANQSNQGDEENENDPKNESSTLSTAFTISFEDDAPVNSKKQFGIRDSIRKFAPPKPHTIEKARTSNKSNNNQDYSYMSIESAPGGCSSKQSFRRDPSNSCRSSGRKSDSSRHSNISDSAAFLIDKMLNCKQGDSLSSICLNSSERPQKDKKARSKGGTPGKKLAHSSDDILDDEIDFCEERSDNGTYIVGADPESDAARRKIDELFGVVKAAEASLLASGNMKTSGSRHPANIPTRPSRLPDKKPLCRERQEHINRLSTGRHSSRSSSLSRQELTETTNTRQRSATRQARNASCDRTSKLPSRRAASQSSRQSSNHDASDGDTQSSRSSFHETEIAGQEQSQQSANNPSMKFNRAFALRRARLGLGEPVPLPRMASNSSSGVPTGQPDVESTSLSPRKTLAQRYANHQVGSSSGQQQQQNLSRTDGGRFSLRMRNNPVPSRLMSGVLQDHHMSGRSSQQSTIIDGYLNKVSSSKESRFNRASVATSSISARHQNSVHSTSAIIPYQSSDEHELASPLGYRSLNAKSMTARRENLSELETDVDYNDSSEKFNYSLGLDLGQDYKLSKSSRACDSAGRRGSSGGQLGALDCLVISAISSLTVKIRGSVCDLMVEHAKRLPSDNETRLIVEEILPQLTSANLSRPKSPTSIEEIDQSLYFDLAQALKNLKKVEQMLDVMKQISNQIPDSPTSSAGMHQSNAKSSPGHRSHIHHRHANKRVVAGTATEGSESNPNSESTSLSPT